MRICTTVQIVTFKTDDPCMELLDVWRRGKYIWRPTVSQRPEGTVGKNTQQCTTQKFKSKKIHLFGLQIYFYVADCHYLENK